MSFTNIQKQVIDGCLLGDGSLIMHKNGKNAYFQYLSSVKEHVEIVYNHFITHCNSNVKHRYIYDKRTNKTYSQFYFRTRSLPEFTEQYTRWYSNKKKVIPENIIINNVSILYWYLGDGELESKNGYIKFHTNSFRKEECVILCQLLGFESKLQKKKENVYLITVPHRQVSIFLNFIGSCPVKLYQHKWKQVAYKNKNIELNGINKYSHLYQNILLDWKTDNYTVYGLSKKYKVPYKCIYNFFIRNNISRDNILINKKVGQFDIDDNLIKLWNSGQEIKRVMNYNASAISECCRGIRKLYKGFKWKFYE